MASKSGITTTKQEIIPSSDLPKFNEALVTMDGFEQQLEPIMKEAREIKVTDAVSYQRAGALIAEIKSIDKSGDSTMSPYNTILKKVKDFIKQRELRVANRVEEIRGIITPKLAEYERAEKAKAQAEQERISRETKQRIEREAEEKRVADEKAANELKKRRISEIREDLRSGKFGNPKSASAKRKAQKELEAAGAMEEALLAQAAADEEEGKNKATEVASSVKVEANTPAMAGVMRRTNYYAECIDQVKFMAGMIFVFKDCVEVSNKKLCEKAREVKDSKTLTAMFPPGSVRAWEEKTY